MSAAALRKVFWPALAAVLALFWLAVSVILRPSLAADSAPARFALVLGNAAYPSSPLATAANDAGLMASILRDAGFDVSGARDLDLAATQQSAWEFLNKLAAAGPNSFAFVYINGYGAQQLGENYLLPAGAPVQAGDTAPAQGLMLSQLLRGLAATPAHWRVAVLDLARKRSTATNTDAGPEGLALPHMPPGMLVAMNAAPGTLAAPETGPYSAYVLAVGAALRERGLPIDEAFTRARQQTSAITGGAQTPWHSSTLTGAPLLYAGSGAPPKTGATPDPMTVMRSRAVNALPEQEAYVAAIDRDTIKGYSEFVGAFAQSALARRITALLAARREALTWRHAVEDDRPEAHWTYLSLYPHAAHATEAQARLAALGAPAQSPAGFKALDFGLPQALEAERPYAEHASSIDVADYFAPPPPLPAWAAVPTLWTPQPPGEASGPFALALPELPPGGGGAPRAGVVGAPAAVAAAIAARKLTPRAPAPALRPTSVVIMPPDSPPVPLSKPALVIITPVDDPPAPPAPPPKSAPVVIMPVEPPAAAATPPPAVTAIVPIEAAPPPVPPRPPAAPAPITITPVEPPPPAAPEAPRQPAAPVMITPIENTLAPAPAAAATPPAPPKAAATVKPRPRPAAPRPAPTAKKPAAAARPAAPARPADSNAPLDLRPPKRR